MIGRATHFLAVSAGLLAVAAQGASCNRGAQRIEPKLSAKELVPMQDNHSGNSQPSQDELGGKDRTTIAVGDTQVPLAAQDAGAIKTALIEYLKTWKSEDRDALLRETASDPAWIDSDGDLRIGAWLLEADQEHLFLRRREPPGQYAGKAHVAHLGKTDQGHWVVRRIEIERIRIR